MVVRRSGLNAHRRGCSSSPIQAARRRRRCELMQLLHQWLARSPSYLHCGVPSSASQPRWLGGGDPELPQGKRWIESIIDRPMSCSGLTGATLWCMVPNVAVRGTHADSPRAGNSHDLFEQGFPLGISGSRGAPFERIEAEEAANQDSKWQRRNASRSQISCRYRNPAGTQGTAVPGQQAGPVDQGAKGASESNADGTPGLPA